MQMWAWVTPCLANHAASSKKPLRLLATTLSRNLPWSRSRATSSFSLDTSIPTMSIFFSSAISDQPCECGLRRCRAERYRPIFGDGQEKEKRVPQDLQHRFKDQRVGTACTRFRVAPKSRLEEYKGGFATATPPHGGYAAPTARRNAACASNRV